MAQAELERNDNPQAEEARLLREHTVAKRQLMLYLDHGLPAKTSRRRLIDRHTLRYLLVKAGYTNMALHQKWSGMSQLTYGSSKEQMIETDSDRLIISFKKGNPYKMEPGYYPTSAISSIIQTTPPDFPLGKDTEQINILRQFDLFAQSIMQLNEKGKTRNSNHAWSYKSGIVRFTINPTDQAYNRPGAYTADEIAQWVNDEGPIKNVSEATRRAMQQPIYTYN